MIIWLRLRVSNLDHWFIPNVLIVFTVSYGNKLNDNFPSNLDKHRPLAFSCMSTQFQRGKTSATILEKRLLLPIHLGRVINIFKQFEVHYYALRKIIHEWKILKMIFPVCPGKFASRSDHVMFRDIVKTYKLHPRHPSGSMLDVTVNDSTIKGKIK